jgi:hypothetical protein
MHWRRPTAAAICISIAAILMFRQQRADMDQQMAAREDNLVVKAPKTPQRESGTAPREVRRTTAHHGRDGFHI